MSHDTNEKFKSTYRSLLYIYIYRERERERERERGERSPSRSSISVGREMKKGEVGSSVAREMTPGAFLYLAVVLICLRQNPPHSPPSSHSSNTHVLRAPYSLGVYGFMLYFINR